MGESKVMEVEFEVRQNTRDIANLTNTVTRVATLVESGEKRHEEDRQSMRDIYGSLKQLNEKIGNFTGMQDKVTDISTQMGGLRHDVKNLENGMQAIPLLKNKEVENEKFISNHELRIAELEKFKNKHDGATGAVRIMIHGVWAVFGGMITMMAMYFFSDFFRHTPMSSMTTMEHREVIGGE